MLYSVYKDLLYGAYYIDAMAFIQSQHIFDALLNNMAFEPEQEAENTKTFFETFQGSTSASSEKSRLEGKQIAVHAVRGTMLKHDAMCGPVGMRTIGQRIIDADVQSNVIGHIVIFETGGGQSIAVPEIADAITKVKKKTYGFVDGFALSAGQYAISYCDEVYASRATDRLGSIGTMMAFRGRTSGKEDQNGLKEFRLYATKSTEKNQALEEALNNGEIKYAIEFLDELNDGFHSDIKKNCPKVEEKHLTGATFKAEDVVGILVDGIKSFEDLVDHIGEQYLADSPDNSNQNSMKQFKTVNSTLGVETLESADGTAALNEGQLETIESALVAGQTAEGKVEKAEQDAKDALAAKQKAEDELATANDRIADLEKETPAGSAGKTPPGESGKTAHQETQEAMADAAALIKEIEG